jgi:hypothetical protein
MADRPRDVAWKQRFQARHIPKRPRSRLERVMADFANPDPEFRHPVKEQLDLLRENITEEPR